VRPLLILRPEPGAGATAARARARGLEPVVAPLFRLRPLPWDAPPAEAYDAILVTSANAARLAGRVPAGPCFAVGEASAAAAREAGFADVTAGPADGEAAAALMAAQGVRRALHLCGRDHHAVRHPEIEVERRIVYAADAVERLPEAARRALDEGAVVLLHSPRAAATFAALAPPRPRVSLAAISAAAAAAAGGGWGEILVAAAPRDAALLELAGKLCNTPPPDAAATGR